MSLLAVWLAAAAVAAPVRLPPVDQCRSDAGFDRFRTALVAAVERKDVDALTALIDGKVRLSFGGRGGMRDFREMWVNRPAEQERLWRELGEVLALGCAVQGKARVFPSMFVQADDLDGFTTWIARPGARLRSRPSLSGPVRARLSWHVLTEDGDWTGGQWIKVRAPGGRRGYVHRSAARSLIDYRLFVEPRGDGWRITAFIAGD